MLTALAEATRRVALGPLVLNVSNRHPGRLLLGLGAGAAARRHTPRSSSGSVSPSSPIACGPRASWRRSR